MATLKVVSTKLLYCSHFMCRDFTKHKLTAAHVVVDSQECEQWQCTKCKNDKFIRKATRRVHQMRR
jgi:hypothetical protein